MSWRNRVVWTEGLFLRPQHFQQHDRFLERHVELRTSGLRSHGWGFSELELNRELLAIGKLSIVRAKGVFPDGTPFCMPDDDPVPPALDIDRNVRDTGIFLAIPIQKPGATESVRGAKGNEEARHAVAQIDVRDVSPDSSESATLEVASANSRLLLKDTIGNDRAAIPLAHVQQVQSNGFIQLDEQFMPTVLAVRAAPPLASFVTELLGMLRQRGDHLASLAVASTRGGASDLREFLLLQVVNRWEPLLEHFQHERDIHPESLFQLCLQLLGDIAALTFDSRRPGSIPPYVHEDLQTSFNPVITKLRAALGSPTETRTISIPLEEKRFGIRVAIVGDRRRFDDSDFILAVNAEQQPETLARNVQGQVTVASSDRIATLVSHQLPGIPLAQIPPPREVPIHRGFLYFRFDERHAEWPAVKTSGGIAIHIPESIPAPQLELWAIRR